MEQELNPQDIKDWVKLAKYHKMLWVSATDRGDLPPTIFAERDGEVICAIIAPQVDKIDGLRGAAMLRKGLNANVITMILDAHVYHGKPGQSKEEFLKDRPKNMQKACDDEGACEAGIISDCLVCHRIDKNKKIQLANIPYYYHGKGTTFKWLDDPEKFCETIMDENDPEVQLEGDVPDAIRQIMDLPSFVDDPTIKIIAAKLDLKERNRQLYHVGRAMYAALSSQGYIVFDYAGYDKPWEEFQK